MTMSVEAAWIIAAGLGALALAILIYSASRFYIARTDRTYMTHDFEGFKRGLSGLGVIWNVEEMIVKGPTAANIDYVGLDPATGKRRNVSLIDKKTGAITLRPQYCTPLPFAATTADNHRVMIEARVQFSINRELLKYVYQLDDFALAIETRIQSAFRAEIGARQDEVLRAEIHAVERAVIAHLRQAEHDGDEAGEAGLAIGVNFHTASFTYTDLEDHAASAAALMGGAAGASAAGAGGDAAATAAAIQRQLGRAPSLLALKPQTIDQLADVFKGRDPQSVQAVLALLDMHTRQTIAEALASSGQLVVVTGQELGLSGATAQRDIVSRRLGLDDGADEIIEAALLPQPSRDG